MNLRLHLRNIILGSYQRLRVMWVNKRFISKDEFEEIQRGN